MKIFNSLTKQKEIFKPLVPGQVSLYVCGITVYDYSHIGHARSLITFDTVVRYLRLRGLRVIYVRNITDIDDKIIKRAQTNKESPESLVARFIEVLHEDERALHILPPDYEPRATQYVPQIIQLIQILLDKQYAYRGNNGDIYFEVRQFKEYGKLSNRELDHLQAGARLAINENKRDPLDFVLWKMASPGEPQWPSPWGMGRPGWHIECSAMSTFLLGQPFDIHGGGIDLKFPHHENEIAQSEAGHAGSFAKIWMHAGLLEIEKEKMSKSVGNIITIRDILKTTHPEVLRYFLLSAHYRSSLSYSKMALSNARMALERLYRSLVDLPATFDEAPLETEFTKRFYQAMDDDFNTALAISVLFDMAHEINRWRNESQLSKAQALALELKHLANIMGLLQENPHSFLQGEKSEMDTKYIEALIDARNEARAAKQWQEADRIRDELMAQGIFIEDSPTGTTWRSVNS
jgi:cysteinyl-tRNA synthetase